MTSGLHNGEADEATPEDLAQKWEEEKPPTAGPLANVAAAAVIAAVGVAGIIGSVALGLGSPEAPQPGMWPFIISIVILLLAAALALVGRKSRDAEKFTRSSWQILPGVGTLIGFALLVSVIGFEIPATLLTFIWLRFLGGESWKTSIVLSIAVVIGFYLIFVGALRVPVPHLF